MEQSKSRNQSVLEYLEALIKEYFTADLRRKIYTKKSDRTYWQRVAIYKKEKVEDITKRNHLPNIFNDTDTRDKYYDIYFPSDKVPLVVQNKKDLIHYFGIGSDVVIKKGEQIWFGVIKETDYNKKEANILIKETQVIEPYPFKEVRRII